MNYKAYSKDWFGYQAFFYLISEFIITIIILSVFYFELFDTLHSIVEIRFFASTISAVSAEYLKEVVLQHFKHEKSILLPSGISKMRIKMERELSVYPNYKELLVEIINASSNLINKRKRKLLNDSVVNMSDENKVSTIFEVINNIGLREICTIYNHEKKNAK